MTATITVLVVDNEPEFADLASTLLEREHESIAATPVTTGADALEALEERDVDCIVCDYEMPEMTGLELLERVREDDPDLPFILFTGRGSEEIASEAIAAGVTQYLQKRPGRERYAMLANQITNAVSQYRTETELRENERRYERTLTTLHETTRDLMRAGTKREIYQAAVDTAGEILDVPIAAAYAFEPTSGALEHAASTSETRELLDPERTFEPGEGLFWEVFSEGESSYYPDVREEEAAVNPESLSRSELIVPLGTHGILVAGSEGVDDFDEPMAELMHILAANTEAALDRAERERLLREHDRELTHKNEELTRLNHTNEIVRGINRGVAQASTRSEIETTVCDRLVDTDRYRFAWVASTDDSPPSPAAWAGVDAAYIDSVREDGQDAPEVDLIRETLESNDVSVVRNVLDDDRWDVRRKAALTYGFQTVLAVPLTDDERAHGVLLVYVAGVDSIGESERAVLGELGETIGRAIRSVERTRALLTDSRIELELECADSRLLLNRLADRVGRPISLEGVVDRGDDHLVQFVRISDPDEAIIDSIPSLEERWASIEALSVLSEGDETVLLELTVAETPLFEVLSSYEVGLTSATARDGVTTIVLDVPQRVETRALIEAISDDYPETALHARRETTQTRTDGRFDAELERHLTDRQFEALQAAHYSGFFQWPRESTGENLADALDVSPPTYHYHLRAAQRKLVSLAFDDHSR
ncbi:bacterio-opsin activator domain-containing protein [Natrialbaceae archaeon GCM10025810]|uniref:bacterio-opsin activator domain-containing protein n=1 Tax=Halovalidus salilacus TaxID=3075124 RepID=UPI0036242A5F